MTPRRSPLPLLVAAALAALTAAAALGFGRIFRDGSFALPLLGVAVIVHALGAVARRRRWGFPTRLGTFTAALALYAAWVTAPDTTLFGIPGPATVDAFATLASDGWTVLRTGVAPVAVTDGVILLLVALVWAAAVVADELAFQRDAALGAVAPGLMLFVVASTLGTSRHRWQTTVVFGAAAALFLLLQHQAVLEQRRAWFTGRKLPRRSGQLGVGATLAASALVTGLVVAPALPGASTGALLDLEQTGGGHTAATGEYTSKLNPLVDIKSRLTNRPNDELFTVAAPMRLHWRIVALDRFDGSQWTLRGNGQEARDALRHLAGRHVPQDFAIGPLGERWLPTAYEPVEVKGLDGVQAVADSATLVAAQPSIAGLHYKVESVIPPDAPTPAQVAGTEGRFPGDVDITKETRLPGDFPASVRQQAQTITAGQATRYDRARSLERFFTDGSFEYDLDVPEGTGNDALVDFLQTRHGFCEQFAGAYAAMARAVGLPTRVAVGFSAGSYDEEHHVFRVSGRHAHAWPEVLLPGLGWTSFEPTPVSDRPGAADPLGTGGPPAGSATPAPGVPGPTDAPVSAPSNTAAPTPVTAPPTLAGARISVRVPAGHASGGLGPVGVLAVAVFAAGLIAGGYALGIVRLKARRRRRRRDAPDPRAVVLGAWAEALDRLDEVGVPRRPALTPLELAAAASRHGAPVAAARPLMELARAYSAAAWAPSSPGPLEADAAWRHVDDLRRTLHDAAPWPRRLRRSLDSTSLRS